jgi:acyl-homoserine-lactone acylase
MEALSNWDRNTGVSSVGTSLAVFWGNQLLSEAREMDRPWDAYVFDFWQRNSRQYEDLGF